MTTDIATYFVRHTIGLDIDNATREKLWNNNLVAIHYPQRIDGTFNDTDNDSIRPEDYSGKNRTAIETLLRLALNGGYVWAEYYRPEKSSPEESNIKVGRVDPQSVKLIQGLWSSKGQYAGRTAILKAVEITRETAREDAAKGATSLLAARPPHVTITQWAACKSRVRDFVDHRAHTIGLDDLLPSEQETMCAEFLRMQEPTKEMGLPQLVHLLLPVGRTLKDLDIYGVAKDGSRIFGQVTHSNRSSVTGKLEALRQYKGSKGDAHQLILFCETEAVEHDDGVTIVPLKKVFELFFLTESGQQWRNAIAPK